MYILCSYYRYHLNHFPVPLHRRPLIRLLLLPATMRLMGTFNWWTPAPLYWLWQHIGLSETEARPALSPAFYVPAGKDKPLETGRDKPQPLREVFASDNGKKGRLSKLVQSAVEAQKQAKTPGGEVHLAGVPNVIPCLSANGEEVMGPEILLWRYPNTVTNGCLLTVESNHFCVLKTRAAILGVHETGQHIIQTPDSSLSGPMQLTFDGEPILLEYEVFYINRAKLLVKTSGVVLSREMAGMDYSVDYSISIATCQDAIRLVEHMLPYRGHQGLHVQDISAYAKPIIEQALNQLTQSTSLLSIGSLVRAAGTGASPLTPTYSLGKEQPYFSQLVHQHLRQFLSTYGITVDEVKVRVAPRDELMKALLSSIPR
jgi:hypothetical protein